MGLFLELKQARLSESIQSDFTFNLQSARNEFYIQRESWLTRKPTISLSFCRNALSMVSLILPQKIKGVSCAADLKYLENFSNPYVKIILVCKECNKELPMKFPSNWKRHYLSHTKGKQHTCQQCGKGFASAPNLMSHMSVHYKESIEMFKQE